jgi:hypothetical protein
MTQALPLPPLEVLQEKFEYNPESGELTYRKRSKGKQPGESAGYLTDRGWLRIKVGFIHYRVHRVVWKLFYGEDPPEGMEIDHINRVKTDNRITNLRIATRKENAQNILRVPKPPKPPKPKKTLEELVEIRRKASRKTAEKNKKPIIVTSPDGAETWYPSLSDAALANSINKGSLSSAANGRIKQTQGLTARYVD